MKYFYLIKNSWSKSFLDLSKQVTISIYVDRSHGRINESCRAEISLRASDFFWNILVLELRDFFDDIVGKSSLTHQARVRLQADSTSDSARKLC